MYTYHAVYFNLYRKHGQAPSVTQTRIYPFQLHDAAKLSHVRWATDPPAPGVLWHYQGS